MEGKTYKRKCVRLILFSLWPIGCSIFLFLLFFGVEEGIDKISLKWATLRWIFYFYILYAYIIRFSVIMLKHWKHSKNTEFIVLKDKYIYKKADVKFEFNKTNIQKIIAYVPPHWVYPDFFYSWKIKLKNSDLVLSNIIIPWSDFDACFEPYKIEKELSQKSPIN